MDLSRLKCPKGSHHRRKRIGRGPGSGHGKRSCRGQKGQGSRAGSGQTPGFEGGQMPLQRRLPKFGFTSLNHKQYAVVNVGQLGRFEAGATVDPAALMDAGLVKKPKSGIKLLSKGEIDRALHLKVHAASGSAKAKIEAHGGSVELVSMRAVPA
jgi:large subunit ribosomal protein L15